MNNPLSFFSILPPLYEQLLDDFFHNESPKESLANCSQCPMLAPKNPLDPSSALVFNKASKCCTYHPDLVNFFVGALFKDPHSSLETGRQRLRMKLAKRALVSPLGIGALWKEDLEGPRSEGFQFGRSQHRLCPYYESEGGLCSIWRYRESVCATWFCRHDAGADSLHFWSLLQDYLEDIDTLISREALKHVAPELEEGARAAWLKRSSLSNHESEQSPSEAEYAKLWQSWAGREEEFYIACFDWSQSLNSADLKRLLGPIGQDCLADIQSAYQQVRQPQRPDHLKLNPMLEVIQGNDTELLVRSYSEFDVRALNNDDYTQLKNPDFDCSKWPEDTILKLYQRRVLVEKEGPKDADG
ncbi:MAG: hypothetical protein P1V97_01685 [Planctomycetota bacterium]|nr:hypothetical protein [Planctomycetota bacterium]